MDEWSLIKSDDHDMAEAILLTEEIMNAVMDMVRVMVRITERSESSLYWTNHVSDVRPRPNEKPWPVPKVHPVDPNLRKHLNILLHL